MKTLRLYGAGLLVALLLTLAAYNASGSSGSEAGATWTLRIPGFNDLNGVAYGNGTFVAVGGGVPLRDGVWFGHLVCPHRDRHSEGRGAVVGEVMG
ncbi:hypothetical protein TO73_2602 (plasmid) [Thermus aquaticus Y51MC23]|jgi:hypothetical protein|uniref:Uncharacterized protein n=1 Tax=Thermus aquaticus (strain ATCC BAA-2747 / Y51MC23) TaxID=498848 RepID=A0ABM5VQ29_THEA5|nr:hypothetical protein TO73_2602 [Thermus aquaticus Y51MC23]